MKKLLLLLTILFTFSVNSQIVVMTAVDLKDGAEDEYLKLEKFYAGIHKEAIKQGLRTGWSLWKTAGNEDDPSAPEYILFDSYTVEQYEAIQNGTVSQDGAQLAQMAYKGKMSKRAIQKMTSSWQDSSKERRVYTLKVVDATILAGGDIKSGDKVTINFMTVSYTHLRAHET